MEAISSVEVECTSSDEDDEDNQEMNSDSKK